MGRVVTVLGMGTSCMNGSVHSRGCIIFGGVSKVNCGRMRVHRACWSSPEGIIDSSLLHALFPWNDFLDA